MAKMKVKPPAKSMAQSISKGQISKLAAAPQSTAKLPNKMAGAGKQAPTMPPNSSTMMRMKPKPSGRTINE